MANFQIHLFHILDWYVGQLLPDSAKSEKIATPVKWTTAQMNYFLFVIYYRFIIYKIQQAKYFTGQAKTQGHKQ